MGRRADVVASSKRVIVSADAFSRYTIRPPRPTARWIDDRCHYPTCLRSPRHGINDREHDAWSPLEVHGIATNQGTQPTLSSSSTSYVQRRAKSADTTLRKH